MRLQHEVALATETEERLDRATLAVHHAVHDAGHMIAAGLALLGVCLVVAAIIQCGKGE